MPTRKRVNQRSAFTNVNNAHTVNRRSEDLPSNNQNVPDAEVRREQLNLNEAGSLEPVRIDIPINPNYPTRSIRIFIHPISEEERNNRHRTNNDVFGASGDAVRPRYSILTQNLRVTREPHGSDHITTIDVLNTTVTTENTVIQRRTVERIIGNNHANNMQGNNPGTAAHNSQFYIANSMLRQIVNNLLRIATYNMPGSSRNDVPDNAINNTLEHSTNNTSSNAADNTPPTSNSTHNATGTAADGTTDNISINNARVVNVTSTVFTTNPLETLPLSIDNVTVGNDENNAPFYSNTSQSANVVSNDASANEDSPDAKKDRTMPEIGVNNVMRQLALRRLSRELDELLHDPPENVSVGLVNSNMFEWSVSIMGPKGTPYESGVFTMKIIFPEQYPFYPPQFKFITKIFHCNIGKNGYIGLDCIDQHWTPILTVGNILHDLVALLYFANPNSAIDTEIAELYTNNREEHDEMARNWTLLYAKPGQDLEPQKLID